EWEPIKISSEIQTVGLYPENHPSPQAFWPKFGIAIEKLNQHKRPRTIERNHEANRKRIGKTAELICLDRSDQCAGPVWPVRWTGLTGRAYRSDRWHPGNPPKTCIQTKNLNQTTTKIDETWGIA